MASRTKTALSGLSRRSLIGGGLAAAAVTLAGCSGADGGNDPVPPGSGVEGGPSRSPLTDVNYPDGYVGPKAYAQGVVTKEKTTISVVVGKDLLVGDWAKNGFSQWLEERTGVHVEYREIGGAGTGADAMTKVNAMLASGDLPDAFMLTPQSTGGGFTHQQLQLYGGQGTFLPLGPTIDEYCQNSQQLFADYPGSREYYTEPDGNIYTMPNMNDAFHTHVGSSRTFIYKPWLDKLGLQMPGSLDEFEQVLTAFKNSDPNGNGKADEIPMIANDANTTFDQFIMGSFMYNPGSPWLIKLDGKVDVAYRQPGWRQGLQYLNRLYGKGLIDNRSFTQTMEQAMVLGNANPPVVGVMRSYYWGGFVDIDQTDPKARYLDYVCIPTLPGPDGKRTAAWDYYVQYSIGNFVVTSASKNPAVAAMWADSQLEMEAMLRAYIGPKDDAWEFSPAGAKGLDGNQAVYNYTKTWPPENGVTWSQAGLSYRSNSFRLGEQVDPANVTFEKALYEQSRDAYYPYRQPQEMQVPPPKMSPDEASQIADIAATLSTYVTQSMAKFTKGELDPNDDAAWQKYLTTLEQMKLETYLEIQTAALNG